MKKLLIVSLLLLAGQAKAIDGIPTLNSVTQTTFVSQSYTASNGASAISLSQTGQITGTPLTAMFWVTGPGAAAVYGFGYLSYCSATTSFYGYLPLSTTVIIDKLDPNLFLYVKSTATGAVNGSLGIFAERK